MVSYLGNGLLSVCSILRLNLKGITWSVHMSRKASEVRTDPAVVNNFGLRRINSLHPRRLISVFDIRFFGKNLNLLQVKVQFYSYSP